MTSSILKTMISRAAMISAALACPNAFADFLGPAPVLPLPGVTSSSYADAASGDVSIFTEGNGVLNGDGIANVKAQYVAGIAQASASFNPGSKGVDLEGGLAFGHADVTYSFEVLGPPGLSPVPLLLHVSGQLSVQGADPNNPESVHSGSKAEVYVSSPFLFYDDTISSRFGIKPFGFITPATVFTNTVYTIDEYASFFTSSGSDSIAALIDPDITFADGFDADGYTLLVSPDAPGFIPPSDSSVPEPSTVAILFSGLGLLTTQRRRRKAAKSS